MTRLVALRDIHRFARYGQQFAVRDAVAAQLVRQGSARPVVYETKVIVPEAPEVQALEAAPFRELHLPHEEPAAVAPASHPVLPESDLPAQGIADSRKRAKRAKRK